MADREAGSEEMGPARTLAILVLQSGLYQKDPDVREAVDAVLAQQETAPLRARIAELEKELSAWPQRYDDAVQPLQKRAHEYIVRAEKAEAVHQSNVSFAVEAQKQTVAVLIKAKGIVGAAAAMAGDNAKLREARTKVYEQVEAEIARLQAQAQERG